MVALGTVWGLAAHGITVSPAAFGAGSALFSPCDSTVSASLDVTTTGAGSTVAGAVVTLDDVACDGAELIVHLTDATSTIVATGTATVVDDTVAGDQAVTVATTGVTDPFGIHDINVILNGP